MSRVYDPRFDVPISGAGFYAEYFALPGKVESLADIDFDAAPDSVGRVNALNQSDWDPSLWADGPQDLFAARFTSKLKVDTAGTYTFYLSSDDGSTLSIDGAQIIDNDGLHPERQLEVTIELSAGTHEIDLKYFEAYGGEVLKLLWNGPDTGNRTVALGGDDLAYENVMAGTDDIAEPAPVEPTPVEPDDSIVAGLRADFFALNANPSVLSDIDFTATPSQTETIGAVDFARSNTPFWENGPTDRFAARITGDLNVDTAGTYTIYLTSDDGSALYVDGARVIGNDGLHGTKTVPVTLDLSAGAHGIEIRYFERGGDQTLQLEWRGPDSNGARVTIDGDSLSQNAQTALVEPAPVEPAPVEPDGSIVAGLRADFFALNANPSVLSDIDFTATPSQTETIGAVDFARSNNPFWESGPTDRFAARISGDLNVDTAGTYTIYLTSDDGSALYIDGARVIGNDGLHGTKTIPVTLDLDAGAHDIEIRYFENGGSQTLQLEWRGPDSNGARVTIDGDSLSQNAQTAPIEEPAPVELAPVEPTPVEPAPVEPAPVEPAPVEPAPVEPTPVEPAPVEPAPVEPTPVEPAPVEPAPVKPPATTAEIEAFVADVRSQPDGHAHGDNPGMSMEHMQLLNLVSRSEATHVAVSDGDWFDPGTWYRGRIPGADAKALIPDGISVSYGGESNASLFTVRVDGELSFATDVDSKMVVDTLIVSPTGRLEIGTAANPINANVNVDIVIANNGDINVDWDPTLVSRGVISHGEAEIHGAEKDAFLKVSAAPMAGNTSLHLAEIPDGWQVGDTIIVTGTHKTGWTNTSRGHIESQDEEVTITGINGSQITFDRALEYDHDTPRADLFAYVANTSRNITIQSEDGDATAVHHRGHVMFMHSDDVDVRYAAFDDLGRTDKSEAAFDVESLSSVEADSNIKGRYSFHFHKTGTTDQENPAMAVGNAVSGGPGWGYAHHSSNANFTDNVSFDVFGAGFAAESGDETGVWIGNMAIKSEGIGWGEFMVKDSADVARQDNGRTGDGFFFAGRLVEAAENIAVNTTNGFVWMHRYFEANPLSANLDHPEIAFGAETIPITRGQIQGFRDNEAFGTHTGITVVKASPIQETHEVRSVFDGFLNWETAEGGNMSYTAHYTMLDFDLINTTNPNTAYENVGMRFGDNTYDMVMNGLRMEGFETGVDLDQGFTFSIAPEDVRHIFIDMETINVRTDIGGYDAQKHRILTSDDLNPGQLSFTLADAPIIGFHDRLNLDGIKVDSIGMIDRATAQEPLGLEFYRDTVHFIANEGYYKTTDGRNVLLIEDFIADRATGELMKMTHVVTLDITDQQLANDWGLNNMTGGAKFNGIVDLGGIGPVARNDSATTPMDEGILINVLANDTDRDGDMLRVDGFMDPQHGDVFLQEDGKLLYQPNVGYSGTDSFDYWAADDAGHFSKATVTIDIWE